MGSLRVELTTFQMVSDQTDIFGNLPDALINEILTCAEGVGKTARTHVNAQVRARGRLRERAVQQGLVKELPDLSHIPTESVSAVDGSLVSKRLASFDLNAAAALAVDGIGFKNDGTNIRHDIAIHPTKPLPYGREVTYALMFCMEYNIASEETNTRKLVMLDGAFSTGLIAISKALDSIENHNDELRNDFFDRWTQNTMRSILEIMTSNRVIALPKRSSANEFRDQTRLFDNLYIDTNGRSTASLILNSNEYAGPFCFDTRRPQTWQTGAFPGFRKELSGLFEELQVVYLKPHPWSHAYRVEMPPVIGNDEQRLHSVLDTIKRQCINSAIMEPYPLYVADRFAKSLPKGANALLDAVRTELIASSEDPEIAYSMLNAYRTEPMVEEDEE